MGAKPYDPQDHPQGGPTNTYWNSFWDNCTQGRPGRELYSRLKAEGFDTARATYIAVGADLARSTGVENFSYIFDGTDPFTGEEYGAGQRALYGTGGVTQIGVEAFGGRVASNLAKRVGGKVVNAVKGLGGWFKAAPKAVPVDANKLEHIFVPKHNLQNLVKKAGSETAAYQEVQHAITNHVNRKNLSGLFEESINVRNINVTVRGIATPEGVKIGTFWH